MEQTLFQNYAANRGYRSLGMLQWEFATVIPST